FRDRGNTLHAAEGLHVTALKREREAIQQLEHLGAERRRFDEWRFGPVRSVDDVAALVRDPTSIEHSRYRQTDQQLVVVERPLDAIAYEQARGSWRACYIFVGDNPSRHSMQKLAHVIADLPDGMKVVSALGRGRQAEELSFEINRSCRANFVRQPPEFGSRWS